MMSYAYCAICFRKPHFYSGKVRHYEVYAAVFDTMKAARKWAKERTDFNGYNVYIYRNPITVRFGEDAAARKVRP